MTDECKEFSKMDAEGLQVLVQRGERAKQAMSKGEFMQDELVPALEREIEQLEEGLPWRPGMTPPSVEQVGVDRIWKSGILFGLGKFWAVLNRMKNEGKEAAAELERRAGPAA